MACSVMVGFSDLEMLHHNYIWDGWGINPITLGLFVKYPWNPSEMSVPIIKHATSKYDKSLGFYTHLCSSAHI